MTPRTPSQMHATAFFMPCLRGSSPRSFLERSLLASVSLLLTGLLGGVAQAGPATWAGGPGTQSWSTTTNWTPASAPGSTSGTTNTDTATFNTAAGSTITIDTNRNLQNLIFDGAAGAFTIGSAGANAGNALALTSGGAITLGATATSFTGSNTTETINAPLVLEPASATSAGTYSFINNSTNSTNLLNIAGNISAGNTNNSETLTLGGANTGANTISGNISNGNASSGLALLKSGVGTWVLTGANTNTGTTTVNNGTLQIGNGTTGSLNGTTGTAVTFTGSGTLNFNEAAGAAQGMGALTFSAGDGAVQSTWGGSGNTSETFSSLANRAVGATGNFVVTTGTNGSTNEINLTGVTGTAGFINQGTFFNGSSYAYMNAPGTYVRAINYGVDSNALTSGAATSLAGGASINQQITGAISAQATASFNTLNISGSNNLTLATGATVSLNGILQSGGGTSTISGGTGLKVLTNGTNDLVIRTDLATDNLIITTPFVANGTNSLTKSGAGTLTLSAASPFSGSTYIDGGTLALGSGASSTALGTFTNSSSGVFMSGTAILDLNGNNLSVSNLNTGVGDVVTDSGAAATITDILNKPGSSLAGVIQDGAAGPLSVSYQGVSGGNYVAITGANTYSGGTTIGSSAGTQFSIRDTSLTSFGTGAVAIYGGVTLTPGSGITANALTLYSASNAALPITISGGTSASNVVTMSGAVTLGTSNPVINVGGSGATLTFSNVIGDGANTYGFTYAADNTDAYTNSLVLSGANTFKGGLTLQPATSWSSNITLYLNNASALGTGTFTVGANGGGIGTATIGNSSGANIALSTNQSQVWNGDFTFSGGAINSGLTFGTGGISLGTSAQLTRTINVTGTGSTLTEQGAISDGTNGTTTLSKTGTGILVLNGASTYDGGGNGGLGTQILAGTITTGNASALGTGQVAIGGTATSVLNLNGTPLAVGSLTSGVAAPTITNGTLYTSAPTVAITGGGGTGATAVVVLSPGNGGTYSLSVIITNAGTGYTSAPTYTLTGGTTGTAATIVSPTYAASKVTTGGSAGILTILGNNATAANYNGVISGNGGVVKQGSGIQIFSGANTYTGPTSINGGTLNVTGSTLSTGAVSVAAGATLGGTGSTGLVAVAGGGNINLQDGTVGTLTVGGLSSGGGTASSFSFDIQTVSGTTTVDKIADAGTLTLTGLGGTTISIGNVNGSTTSLANGSYALLTYTGAQQSLGDLSLSTTSLDGKTLGLTQIGDVIYLNVADGASTANGQYTLTTTAGSLNVHAGGETTTLSTSITNTGTTPQDTLNYTGLGATGTGVAGSTSDGGPLADSGGSASNTSQTFTSGSSAGNVTVTPTAGVTNSSASGTPAATVNGTTINVYSGESTWAGTGTGGSWGYLTGTGNSAFGTNWGANQGSPGVDSNFTGVDTATFSNVASQATQLVTLDGASPNVNSITFNAPNTSYTIARGTPTAGVITLSGIAPSINVVAGAHTISAPVSLAVTTVANVASGQQLTLSGAISGGGGLSNTGAGTTVLSNAAGNTYAGGTTVTSGKFVVDSASGSGTGTDGVSVSSGAVLAGAGRIAPTTHTVTTGVVLNSGSSLISGDVQTNAPVVTGNGLTLDNTAGLSSILSVNSGTLTFALGANNGGDVGSAFSFGAPNTNSTFINVLGNTAGEVNFTGANSVTFQDLTNGSLALTLNTPYLLIQTGALDNSDITGLVTSLNGVLSLDGNGYVVGVGTSTTNYTPISITQLGSNGDPLGNPYYDTSLYLFNGDLELVPEPGTWALMLGSLALLVIIQRRRANRML